MRIHRVADDVMLSLGSSSKLNTEWAFLTMLRDEGRQAADLFLQAASPRISKSALRSISMCSLRECRR